MEGLLTGVWGRAYRNIGNLWQLQHWRKCCSPPCTATKYLYIPWGGRALCVSYSWSLLSSPLSMLAGPISWGFPVGNGNWFDLYIEASMSCPEDSIPQQTLINSFKKQSEQIRKTEEYIYNTCGWLLGDSALLGKLELCFSPSLSIPGPLWWYSVWGSSKCLEVSPGWFEELQKC